MRRVCAINNLNTVLVRFAYLNNASSLIMVFCTNVTSFCMIK